MRVVLALILASAACTAPAESEPLWTDPNAQVRARPPEPEASIAGIWRATLLSPGGELPFTLSIEDRAGQLSGAVHNDEERVQFSAVEREGDVVRLRLDGYDSGITATLDDDGRQLRGEWRKTVPGGESKLPFSAVKGDNRRFSTAFESTRKPVAGAPASIAGRWVLEFTEEDGKTFPARAELTQDGARLAGTILTETGDYRFLEGRYDDGWLLLSVFDGAHAFLFQARVSGDEAMEGDFWSRDSYHATWTGHRLEKGERDGRQSPWKVVELTGRDRRLDFDFPALDGGRLTSKDRRFDGKVVLVDVFGTWCPNCNDQAPVLARWHRQYRERGLEIVGLAYEMTGEAERDLEFVAKYRDRYGIEFPLLLAGSSDKKAASSTLPDLSEVAAFPTTIFIARDGKVRSIYSGFAGPATGRHHEKMVEDHEQLIEKLLAEPE